MTEPNPRPEPTTPGAMLRAAREKQGLHIAALAAAIKVSPRKLDALENDRWSELPDATFTRALAQTVCRTLKIDARPVLDKLPAAAAVALEPQDAGLNAPFRDRPGRDDPGAAFGAIRPMVWAAAVLMAAAVAIYFMPSGLISRMTAPMLSAAPVATPASAPASGVPLAPAVATTLPAATGVDAAASAASAGLAAQPALALPASAPATSGETVFSAPPAGDPAATAAAAPAAGLVQLRTSEASWIEVRDARGATLLSRTVMPGESVGLDGNLPIRLTIGNASATQLGFRGQPVDLSARTRDNIARVELQ
jgi:cytoskeleton protein RodZ